MLSDTPDEASLDYENEKGHAHWKDCILEEIEIVFELYPKCSRFGHDHYNNKILLSTTLNSTVSTTKSQQSVQHFTFW